MNRLYSVESTPSVTGSNADHRLALRSGEIENVARALAGKLGAISGEDENPMPAGHAQWISALVGDLQQNRGNSIVIAGENQPPFVHALAHAMNHALGNAGATDPLHRVRRGESGQPA